MKRTASLFSPILIGCLVLGATTGVWPWNSQIVIDKSQHRLTYYTFSIPVRTFSIATGKTGSETPEGMFPVVMLVKQPWYLKKNIPGGDPKNPLGSRWIGLQVGDTDGSKYGIHGTNDPTSIGKDRSEGCIRMKNEDVNWLYQHVQLGTWVIIRS
ncbi:L,D-transpeptidase [Effusibacillus dendaii]|uniref:Transpeptidase n=1 Tax=Effusibacillus dendaii TaxID=2743772 RepID=A0A7I8D7Q5_9BACL|nr:L,D-transpeptidase [Effusibacillus dendaii]BCJ86193.1 transpeptidase [Effusibacillus dendaii]